MVKPTSDLGEDVDESNAPECTVCETKIIRSPTHRVVPRIEDGVVKHRHFCSEKCHTEFETA
ncbi:hypothetical protein HUB97_10050 [Halorubraceae archaeon YAN]|nr:hypothetical protein [Halorubraceae archaeon YAN]